MCQKKDAGAQTVAVVHVALRVAGALAVRLEHADGGEDLRLGEEGHVVPLLEGRAARDVAPVGRDGVLAGNEGRAARDEAEERGHGDAAVLDLRVPEPADVRLDGVDAVLGEDRGAREVERVPVAGRAGHRVLERLEVRLRLRHLRLRRGRRDGRHEGGGRREAEGEGELHLLRAGGWD